VSADVAGGVQMVIAVTVIMKVLVGAPERKVCHSGIQPATVV